VVVGELGMDCLDIALRAGLESCYANNSNFLMSNEGQRLIPR